jgi:transcriptional antiterminator RfaH
VKKKVAERLEKADINVYCPLQTTLKQWSDRKKKVKVPIFPSYVFVHVNEKERQIVLQDPGVLNFVYWQGKPAIIKNEEIEIIRECLEGNTNEAEVVGDEITITQGILSGTKGKIKEIQGNKIILTIESIGITVTITRKGVF